MKAEGKRHVAVCGLTKKQFEHLRSQLSGYPFILASLDPKELLRRRKGEWNLIVLTRFAGHKHFKHAKKIASGHVMRVPHGTNHAVSDAIVEFFRRKGNTA